MRRRCLNGSDALPASSDPCTLMPPACRRRSRSPTTSRPSITSRANGGGSTSRSTVRPRPMYTSAPGRGSVPPHVVTSGPAFWCGERPAAAAGEGEGEQQHTRDGCKTDGTPRSPNCDDHRSVRTLGDSNAPRKCDPTMPRNNASTGPPRASSGSLCAAATVRAGSDFARNLSLSGARSSFVSAEKLASTSESSRPSVSMRATAYAVGAPSVDMIAP